MGLAVHPQGLAEQITGQCQTCLCDLDDAAIDKRVVLGVASAKLERAPDVQGGPSTSPSSAHAHPLGGFIQHIREPRRDVQLIIRDGGRKGLERTGADHRIPRFLIQHLIAG
jgi:hypothetical protein